MLKKLGFIIATMLCMTACQTNQSRPVVSVPNQIQKNDSSKVATPEGVKITPYELPEIKREKISSP